jgi:hypothetical protein
MDRGERPAPCGRARGTVTRPANLAASWWAELAELVVELGPVGSWTPSGPVWGVGEWGVAFWGSGYLSPAAWHEITASLITFDCDTGRNGVSDPGEIGTASLTLYDPEGELGIAGNEKERIGSLLRARVRHVASGAWRGVFYGKVTDAQADESLSLPTISMRAVDMLGSVLATDDAEPLPAQSVIERLDELLDRAQFPDTMRALDPDPTRLLAIDKAGNRLDAARGAVSSAVGGTLFAVGDGTIRYEHGATNIAPDAVPDYRIGTVAGAVCPSSLSLGEASSRVINYYDWTNQAKNALGADSLPAPRPAPLNSVLSEPGSMHRYGRLASVRTDLLNANGIELDELVRSELSRTAWDAEAVESCEITVADAASAELVLAAIGELAEFDYTGADPWHSVQVLGNVAHHVSADEWRVALGAYPPTVGALWGVGRWGVSAWASE